MGESDQPRRNFFDVVASWLSGGDEEKGPRRWLAQLFALLGATFAVLQLLFSTLDLANRAAASLLTWLPYLVPSVLVVGAIVAIYMLASASSSRPQKRWAGAALGLIFLVSAGWGGWSYHQANVPPKAVIVIVADFEGQQATKGVDWGRRIYERVKSQVQQLNLDELVEVQRVFEAYASSEEARTRNQARKASLVLWGWYDDLGVSPHFELMRTVEKFEANLAAPPQDLTDFDLYLRSGPQEMAYIVAVVLGLIQYSEGDYPAAESLFTTALETAPETEALLSLDVPRFYRANARFFSHSSAARPMDQIVEDLNQAVALRPDFWQAHWNLALMYTDYCTPTLTLDAALAEAETVRDLQPNNAQAHWLVGRIRAERGEWEAARAAYQEAIRIDPQDVVAHEDLARALDGLGQTEEAAAAYQQAVAMRRDAAEGKPEDPAEAFDKLGYAYLNAGEYEDAISAFQEALRLALDNADYHRHLGNAYYWQGKTRSDVPSSQIDLAIAEYETARHLAPDDNLLLTVLGGAYAEAGRAEDALRAYEEAVRAAPCDDEALFLLASQYDQAGRPEDAEAAYERLVELNPGQVAGWHYLATAAYMREAYDSAADYYRRAAAIEPQNADLSYGLASSLYYLGDYEGAEEAYRHTLELLPDDTATRAGWADTLAKLGRTAEAITAYEQVVEQQPEDGLSWLSLGLLYQQPQRWEEAAMAFGKAGALTPENALAHAAQGWALQQLGDFEGAAAALELAVQNEPENAYYWESLAVSYAASARPEDAFEAAQETIKRNPASATAYLVRGGVYEDRDEKEKARADYQRVLELIPEDDPIRETIQAALDRLEE